MAKKRTAKAKRGATVKARATTKRPAAGRTAARKRASSGAGAIKTAGAGGRSIFAKSAASGGAELDPRLAEIAKAYAADTRVTIGRLFSSVGLRVGGKIFAMVVRGKLVVKLPKPRVDELVAAGVAERFEPGPGHVMKEWATFAGSTPSWSSLARESYDYVGRL